MSGIAISRLLEERKDWRRKPMFVSTYVLYNNKNHLRPKIDKYFFDQI